MELTPITSGGADTPAELATSNQIRPIENATPSSAAVVEIVNPMLAAASHNRPQPKRGDDGPSDLAAAAAAEPSPAATATATSLRVPETVGTAHSNDSNKADDVDDGKSQCAGEDRVRLRAWCVGNSAASLTLLVLLLITTATYFALQATPLMGVLIGESDVRGYVGMTSTVEIAGAWD